MNPEPQQPRQPPLLHFERTNKDKESGKKQCERKRDDVKQPERERREGPFYSSKTLGEAEAEALRSDFGGAGPQRKP